MFDVDLDWRTPGEQRLVSWALEQRRYAEARRVSASDCSEDCEPYDRMITRMDAVIVAFSLARPG